MQNVLILGASGFVGGNVLKALTKQARFRPIAVVRAGRRIEASGSFETRHGNVRDVQDLKRLFENTEAVINCIGGNPRVMVEVTNAVCDAARQQPVERIVHISSLAVYGQASGQVTEDMAAEGPLSSYGASKRTCEEIVQRYVRDGGRAYILRPGCVFGPGSPQWTSRMARLLLSGRVGDLGEAGDGICNLTYTDDLTSAIIAAVDTTAPNGDIFNVASDDRITWNEFFSHFGRAIGATPIRRRSSRQLAIEARVITPILRVASLATRAIPRARNLLPEPITPSLIKLWRQEIWMDAGRAAKELGYLPTSCGEAINSSAAWFRSETTLSESASTHR